MKYTFILLMACLSVLACSKQKKEHSTNSHKKPNLNDVLVTKKVDLKAFDCPNFQFKTNKKQADTIVHFFEKAKIATGNQKTEFEQLFFCSFPNSFESMQNIFGFD